MRLQTSRCRTWVAAVVTALALAPPLSLTAASPAAAYEGPTFVVDPIADAVWGHGWSGGSVSLSAVTRKAVTLIVGGVDTDGGSFAASEVDYDIVAGATIRVSDGTDTRDHVVTDLSIGTVDVSADTVSGTAAKNTAVAVAVSDGPVALVTSTRQGDWTASFAGSYDITPRTSGYAVQTDTNGNATHLTWTAPDVRSPVFTADPTAGELRGEGWTPGASLIVNGEANDASWTDDSFTLDMATAAGDHLTISDGTSTKDHTVTDLAIGTVDVAADTVSGTATKATSVVVSVDDGPTTTVTTDAQGNWAASFAGTHNITTTSTGHAVQTDTDGDATHLTWTAPDVRSPVFTADPTADTITGTDWGESATITIDIEGTSSTTTGDSDGAFVFDLALHGTGIAAGQTVTISDGTSTKDHTVTDLAIGTVDVAADTVSGTATKATSVVVSVDDGPTTTVTTDAQGNWAASFAGTHNITTTSTGHAVQTDTDGDATHLTWTAPDADGARFTVDLSWEYFTMMWGDGWEPDTELRITATDESGNDHVFLARTSHDGGFWAQSYWWDVEPGDTLTVFDGSQTKTLVVSNPSVTSVDVATDTVSGAAVKDETVTVTVKGGPSTTVVADSKGTWVAPFPTYDIEPSSTGLALHPDADGDSTAVVWRADDARTPPFSVDPQDDTVQGWLFDPGATVTVTLNGTPYSTAGQDELIVEEWGHFWWQAPDGIDISPSDQVSVAVGDYTSLPHTVTGVRVTGVDTQADTVSGTADPGTWVHVALTQHRWPSRTVQADASGMWVADFASPIGFDADGAAIDLQGTPGFVAQYECDLDGAAGACTADDDWFASTWVAIPWQPSFTVDPEADSIQGSGWAGATPLTVKVGEEQVAGSPNTEADGSFALSDIGRDLTEGDMVTVYDGVTLKEHTVTSLAISSINVDDDTISGTAQPGDFLSISVETSGERCERGLIVQPSGTWTVDFTDDNSETEDIDLVPGMTGTARDEDQDGDATQVLWRLLNPTITVWTTSSVVWGTDWVPDEGVTVTVGGTDHIVTPGPDGSFELNPEPGLTIVPGATELTASQGETVKTLVPTTLAITEIDVDGDTVSGQTSSSAGTIGLMTDDWTWTQATVGTDGTWTATFVDVGYDIVPGSSGCAIENDEDGDSTQVDWFVPNPTITVDPDYNAVWGQEWPPGTDVTISVNSSEAGVGSTDGSGWFLLEFDPSDVDLVRGDTVTVSSGTFTKSTTISPLAVVSTDAETDTLTGVASPNGAITVGIWDEGGQSLVSVETTADGDGEWSVSLAGDHDLVPGTGGYAVEAETDGDGDGTQVDWRVPNPTITVWTTSSVVWGADWEPGEPVMVAVDGVEYPVTPGPDGTFELNPEPGLTIVPGATELTASQGETVKTLVPTTLTIIAVDIAADTVSGSTSSPDGTVVAVSADDGTHVETTVSPDSTWTADFATAGYDITPGSSGCATQWDDDGDATWVDWAAPNP